MIAAGQAYIADRKRRRHSIHKSAEPGRRQGPDFDLDGVAPGIDPKKVNGAAPIDRNSSVDGKKPLVPMIELPSPKAIPKPTAQ